MEIKSYEDVESSDTRKLKAFLDTWDRHAEGVLLSRYSQEMLSNGVRCLQWQTALREIFSI